MVPFEDFKKITLKIARIIEATPHPNADRLYLLKLDIGNNEERTVVAGIRKAYNEADLKDKSVVFVENLEPAVIRGIESKGMVLAAQDGETLAILSPDKFIAPGSIVK